jgi:hypothetical protein
MTQRTLFDAALGEQERDHAIDRVEENADALWLAVAYNAVLDCARLHPWGFTTDDVWARIGGPPREPRAMGAVMRRAKADGVIVPLDEWRLTARASAHRRPCRVWRRA